jgi:hypothetical protein
MVLLGFCIGYIIYQRKEIKRLHECWKNLFDSKLEGESRWRALCDHQLDTITKLALENNKLKSKQKNVK